MSRTRRKFSSQFKADLCVELLKGEKDLNSLASENSLLPNLLRNWKKDFLEKCSKAFDDTSENYWKEKYLAEHREKEDYARKVGQPAMQVDWLKKNLRRLLDQDTKTSLLQSLSKSRACASGREREKKLSVRIAAGLPGLNRTKVSTISTGTINLLKRNLRARLSSTESTQITPPGAPVSFQSSCGCRDSKPAASEPCGLCVKWASMLSTQR